MVLKRAIRLGLVLAAATVGLSSSASANEPVISPDCEPYGNPTEIVEYDVDTSNHNAGAIARLGATGVLCGTEITAGGGECKGKQTIYDTLEIDLPQGARFTSTNGIAAGSFAGNSVGDAIQVPLRCKFGADPIISEDGIATIETRPTGSGDCPGSASEVACYYGYGRDDDLGVKIAESNAWVEERNGVQTLTLGPTRALNGLLDDIGYLGFSLNLCERFGSPNQPYGAEQCGSHDAPGLFTNGNSSHPIGCTTGGGNAGLFTIVGEMRNGTKTPQANDCVFWSQPLTPITRQATIS